MQTLVQIWDQRKTWDFASQLDGEREDAKKEWKREDMEGEEGKGEGEEDTQTQREEKNSYSILAKTHERIK